MSDPIIADQTQDPTPPTFPEMTDFPTIPTVPQNIGTTPQASGPTDIPPIITNTKTPKKRSGKLIATILGIFLLIGAVGAGVVLVGQKQLFQQKATGNCTYNCGSVCIDAVMCPNPDYDATCTQNDCPPGYAVCSCEPNGGGGGGGKCDDGTDPDGCVKYICPYGDTNNSNTCDEGDTGVSWNFYSMAECSNMTCGTQCCQIDWTKNNIYCGFKTKNLSCVHGSPPPTSTNTPTPTPTATPTRTPTPTPRFTSTPVPTPKSGCGIVCQSPDSSSGCPAGLTCYQPPMSTCPPGAACMQVIPAKICRNPLCPTTTNCVCGTPTPPSAVCSAVKAYDTDWNLLDGTQLSALSAGSVVRFTISGTPANQIDKARFTINGVPGSEITTKKPGTDEYYVEYTIPADVFSFTVTAQVHHLTLGWF